MNRERARALLHGIARGEVDPDAALAQLAHAPAAALGEATLDLHRALRQGFPEVVLGEGKSVEQMVAIVSRLAEAGQGVLVTRVSAAQRQALLEAHPTAEVNELARTVWLRPADPVPEARASVVVITAGTSDLPVAEEAVVTLQAHGVAVERVVDVGVAGIHRLTPHLPRLARAAAVVVVAGMDGALASVIGGLVAGPVIAVPTSVGYGASLGGIAALLSMLSSCAAGVTVVNIDNGFGAGMAAARIVRGADGGGDAKRHVVAPSQDTASTSSVAAG